MSGKGYLPGRLACGVAGTGLRIVLSENQKKFGVSPV